MNEIYELTEAEYQNLKAGDLIVLSWLGGGDNGEKLARFERFGRNRDTVTCGVAKVNRAGHYVAGFGAPRTFRPYDILRLARPSDIDKLPR